MLKYLVVHTLEYPKVEFPCNLPGTGHRGEGHESDVNEGGRRYGNERQGVSLQEYGHQGGNILSYVMGIGSFIDPLCCTYTEWSSQTSNSQTFIEYSTSWMLI